MIFHNHFEVNLFPNGTGPKDFPKVLEVSILSVLLTLGFQTEFRWSKLSIKATTLFFVLEALHCTAKKNWMKESTWLQLIGHPLLAFSLLFAGVYSRFAYFLLFFVLLSLWCALAPSLLLITRIDLRVQFVDSYYDYVEFFCGGFILRALSECIEQCAQNDIGCWWFC